MRASTESHARTPYGAADVRRLLLEGLYARLSPAAIAQMAAVDPARARREVTGALADVSSRFGWFHATPTVGEELVQDIASELLGFGVIDSLLADESVTEVMANGTARIFYERAGQLFEHYRSFDSEQALRTVIDRIISPLGRRLDEQHPTVSARLPEGHRVHAIIPPIAIDGSVLTIRKFRRETFSLADLIAQGAMPSHVAQMLMWAVRSRLNIAVSGGTGSGKTTLLNALAREVPSRERILTIEDAAELRFDAHPHVVRLEARGASQEGTGAITIRDLVVNALRMRPDRIVVGEVRGEEALEMLQAMNTGHDGSLTTLHANSAAEVPRRLLTMVGYSGLEIPARQIEAQVASAIDVIVHLERQRDGVRRVTEVAQVALTPDGSCAVDPLVTGSMSPLRGEFGEVDSTFRWKVRSGGNILESALEKGVISQEEVARWLTESGC